MKIKKLSAYERIYSLVDKGSFIEIAVQRQRALDTEGVKVVCSFD
ncbi:MAG: hypothetical protein BWY42_01812 [Candidatus Omnitrophica bacterium ADurb.Bin277]|nr:MAG: hypothetical protein BWY42_01812 [Candidatus Omnitrophica bacterium ADurb.Bin277]